MIILDWNIRGLGDFDKKAKVLDFIYLFGFSIVALQETKLESPSFHLIRSIGGTWIQEWTVLDPIYASEETTYWKECQTIWEN